MTSSTRRFVRDNFILKNQQKPKMDDGDRNMLVNFYWDDVKKLEEILGLKGGFSSDSSYPFPQIMKKYQRVNRQRVKMVSPRFMRENMLGCRNA